MARHAASLEGRGGAFQARIVDAGTSSGSSSSSSSSSDSSSSGSSGNSSSGSSSSSSSSGSGSGSGSGENELSIKGGSWLSSPSSEHHRDPAGGIVRKRMSVSSLEHLQTTPELEQVGHSRYTTMSLTFNILAM